MHLFEKTISSKPVYEGKIIKIKSDTVLLEDNTEAIREVIMHHGGVCVVPVTDKNEIIMVRQYRYPFAEIITEIPAGKLNPGEDHLECGRRELLEETGMTAESMTYIGHTVPLPAYCTEKIHMYIAEGLTFSSQKLDEDEFLDVIRIPFEKAVDMVINNELTDAKTQVAIMKAWIMSNNKKSGLN